MARKPLSVTIDEKLLRKWNKYCEDNNINRSRKIEKIIKEFLIKEGIRIEEKN